MKKKITRTIIRLLDYFIPKLWYKKYYYSQDGEDVLIEGIINELGIKKGFYVDCGAYHPYRFNNTYLLYKKGWRGINIEPTKSGYLKLKKHRKRDINIYGGLSNEPGVKMFYKFDEPALNTFDVSRVFYLDVETKYRCTSVEKVPIFTLNTILEEHKVTHIDLLNVDCEEMDEKIILSLDLNKYKPTIIIIEDHSFNTEKLQENHIYQHLKESGYKFSGKTERSIVYILKSKIEK